MALGLARCCIRGGSGISASLDGSLVRTVFVSPDVQARGVGKLLMAEVERAPKHSTCNSGSRPCAIAIVVIIMQRSLEDRP
jgi:hypothetical protein